MKNTKHKNAGSYLEERIKHLEGVERFVIDSLEVAASLGDFQSSINKLHDVTTILEETRIKVQGLIPFEIVALFLVDEESNDFTLKHIDSEDHRSYIQSEVDNSIDDGIFAWALREKRPVIVPTKDHQKFLVLHSMATARRIRGMFIGVLNDDMHSIMNVSLSLFSLILFNSANAIESFELYRKIREINSNLERIDNYRLLFEAAPDGVEVVDAEGKIIDSNDSQKKLLGYSQEALTGNLSADYFSENSQASLLNNPFSLKGCGYWEGEIELVSATGKMIPVWRKEKAIYDHDHKFIGAVVYNRDLTHRKQAEETIRENEEKYRNLFESSHDAIMMLAPPLWRFTAGNPATLKMFGVGNEAVFTTLGPGELSPELQPDGRSSSEKAAEMIQLAMTKGSHFFEWTHRRLEGESFPATVLLTRTEIGGLAVLQATVRDITARLQADEEKQRLEQRLQRAEKMESLGNLAGGVAHDLNNVLGVLSGYSELLVERLPEGNPLREYAANILKSSEKGAAIIQDLLTLARRGVMVDKVINLNGIVSNLLAAPEFKTLLNYHPHVTIKTDLAKDLLNINGSPVHLEKTVMNLVSNAAEAIVGSGKVHIRTENRYLDKAVRGYEKVKEGDYVVLMVSDSGKGIPSVDFDKIFEPFYTKKKMGRSGTGLGLAIVWGTVQDHKGYIDVQSVEGEGTTFTLYFPVTREKMTEDVQKIPIEQYMSQGESILVIDDVQEQRQVASTLLMDLGYQVKAVSSGEEAVEHLKNNKADILVLDMIMDPGIDGLETYQRIVKINQHQKAIIVSGFSETERVNDAQKLGAGAYVKKPYLKEKIGMAVRQELDRI